MTQLVQDGTNGSASTLNTAFNSASIAIQDNINKIGQIYSFNLGQIQNILNDINLRSQVLNSLPYPGALQVWSAGNAAHWNVGKSSSTLRVDSAVANLGEKRTYNVITLNSVQFSSISGTTQTIDTLGRLFTVSILPNQSVPIGTLVLNLPTSESMSSVTIDLFPTPGNPSIQVYLSSDGNNFSSSSINLTTLVGYRLYSTFTTQVVKAIKLVITPEFPDNLGGLNYTFGITDMSGVEINYQRASQLWSNERSFSPYGTNIIPRLVVSGEVKVFLSISATSGSTSFFPITNGYSFIIPGVTYSSTSTNACNGNTNVINATLPAGVYPNSISAIWNTSQLNLPVVWGLSSSDPNIPRLTSPILSIQSNTNMVLLGPLPTAGTTFTLKYSYGPSLLYSQVYVDMNINADGSTPTFSSLYLEQD